MTQAPQTNHPLAAVLGDGWKPGSQPSNDEDKNILNKFIKLDLAGTIKEPPRAHIDFTASYIGYKKYHRRSYGSTNL